MLKNGSAPQNHAEFQARITRFLDDFGRNGRK
jgi:type VI secretion system protein ImpK